VTDPERILDHPVLGPLPPARLVPYTYAGQTLSGREGDTVATAMWMAGIRAMHPGAGSATGNLYCGIGHCFACHLTVDGVQGVRACLVPLREGMCLQPDPDAEHAR
jgi:sarcosine oxidase subunit alpha